MADYIDRQAAIDMFQRQAYDDWNKGTGTTWANAFSEAADMIENLPSADAIEVVRCKDCKYRIPITTQAGYFTYICAIEYELSDPYDLTRNVTDDNWYCADGEKKYDGTFFGKN